MKQTKTILAIAGLTLAAAGVMTNAIAQDKAQPTSTAAPAAAAAPAAVPGSLGNAQRGKDYAYTCRGCHGIEGMKNAYPNYHVPRIGGQSETYLRNALMEYRKGTRKHPTMRAQATSFNEQQLADIAAYLASVKP